MIIALIWYLLVKKQAIELGNSKTATILLRAVLVSYRASQENILLLSVQLLWAKGMFDCSQLRDLIFTMLAKKFLHILKYFMILTNALDRIKA